MSDEVEVKEERPVDTDPVRALVDLRGTLQKQRIAFSNRVGAIERGSDQSGNAGLFQTWSDRFDALETACEHDIAALVKDIAIVQDLCEIRGVGPMLAAKIISMVDISRADTVSALWRYAGYAVIDGVREKPTKGEKLHYNARLKTTLYLVAGSFLKSKSPYASVYYEAREYYQSARPDWTKAHQHNAALRKMIKVFLAHLWEQWRTLEGLPVRNLYVEEYQGHTHIIKRETMGWPPL